MSRPVGPRRAFGALTVLASLACGEDPAPLVPEEPVGSVVVSPSTSDLSVGDTLRLTAQARSAGGAPMADRPFEWRSDKAHVAAVSTTGLVTAVAEGTALVSATTGGRSQTVRIRVVASPSAVSIVPSSARLGVGDTVRLSAVVLDRSRRRASVALHSWTSDRSDIAAVDGGGLVTAVGEGFANVTVSVGGVSATASVEVLPDAGPAPTITSLDPGQIQAGWGSFTMAVYGGGFQATSRVAWDGVPLTSVVVDAGLIHASVTPDEVRAEGVAQITVENPLPDGRTSESVQFVVHAKPALSVDILVPGNALFVGGAVSLNGIARDQFGDPIPGKRIDWTVSDTTVAKVAGAVLLGVTPGPFTLTAHAYPTSSAKTMLVSAAPAADVAYDASPSGYPELFARSFGEHGGIRRLQPSGVVAREPAVSPDGESIAFVGTNGSNQDIYVMASDGTGSHRLTTAADIDDQPTWSPDGAWIAFRSFRDGKSDIWIMRADGSGQTNLTHGDVFVPEEYNDGPAFSPNGERIVFSRGFGLGQALYLMGTDGSELVGLVDVAGSDLFEPAWSPDGAHIAMTVRERSSGTTRIQAVASGGGPLLFPFGATPTDAGAPAWLDGDWLAATARAHPTAPDLRTLILLRQGTAIVAVPLGIEQGEIANPVSLPR